MTQAIVTQAGAKRGAGNTAHHTRMNPVETPVTGGPGDRTASALAHRTAGQVLDVLAGRRPLRQIRHWVSGPVAGLLATMVRSRSTAGPVYRLRSVHACPISARTVEACAVIADTRRVRALTMRLERQSTQWSCTMLAFV
ncbi:hypothetical protein DFQ14_11759 [Halopolyspora algeriensis]|uniref:3-hydroxyacyl-CoA dehydrogenase n=1 Tax=Halopolyspora algeriensis TaxID=1500506 RepID=A0A368VEV3_9ACTN|nr:Rv3235 family protein [Halopolyspora algeriensis]RCW39223.1 hypothetical protein DFQ14_11759 [Halopolyspora algeriensis]TQM47411.1 hypothetical protein FHU43_3399 [Halopolyspora algeriensis]